MDLAIWLPATFALGLVCLGLCFAFLIACEKIREVTMMIFTAVVAALVFIYLMTAMIWPEWF